MRGNRVLSHLLIAATCAGPLAAQAPSPDRDRDRDRDGLSDFHEVHKYFTDPDSADSDGDGVPDGEWGERREYQYYVRSVVQVLKPVTPEYLVDDFQDARVLDETETYVELEVLHYPFNTVNRAIEADPRWRRNAKKLAPWTRPGRTANWDDAMRQELRKALETDGIDASKLDDRELVSRVAPWLCNHAKYHDGFSTFVTAFDDEGRPSIPERLRSGVQRDSEEKGLSLEEQWERELFAKGMFEQGTRGSCTSSAIYLNGCLRALGVPTRIVLVIPLIDANDPAEHVMLRRGIQHPEVRRIVREAAENLRGSWASHTFNEVYVGGRWRRLNYGKLGQDILDPGLYGLTTHIATFDDWADANMPKTIGKRQSSENRDDIFGYNNPYSCVSLRDGFGPHCQLERPDLTPPALSATIAELLWSDDPELHRDLREWAKKREGPFLYARIEGLDAADRSSFFARAPSRLWLRAEAHPDLGLSFDLLSRWGIGADVWLPVFFGASDRAAFVEDVVYRPEAGEAKEGASWVVAEGLSVR